jgi:peptidoglycan hydrolase CwlO-like protein
MNMQIIQIIAIVFGASGFWKLMEFILARKKNKAEAQILNAQATSQIISNWVSWSQKLEERVKELEGKNTEMQNTISNQKEKIIFLERDMKELEKLNADLREKIEQFKIQHNA